MRKHFDLLMLLLVAVSVMGCASSQKVGTPDAPKPSAALAEQRSQGQMKLRIQVAEDGTPIAVKIEQSSGFTALDQEVAAWVQKNWHWPSGKIRSYRVPMAFKLR